jgi:cation diffusion facilitator CzcD-associated flavoprotein CzcO
VVGTGYGGLCAGARLVEAGFDPADIRMLDKAGDVGGTWYWNRYRPPPSVWLCSAAT